MNHSMLRWSVWCRHTGSRHDHRRSGRSSVSCKSMPISARWATNSGKLCRIWSRSRQENKKMSRYAAGVGIPGGMPDSPVITRDKHSW